MATWPTSVATDALLYIAVNNLQTTLSGSIDNVVTTITLASSTGFPTAGGVTIDTEVIFYTGISGAQLTGCTRGADGTTAASHSSGVPVGATVIAAHHNLLKNEIIAIESSLNLTASQAVVTSASGRVTTVAVTPTEVGYLAGVTSSIQTQLNATISNPSAAAITITPTTNQLILGTTRTITINAPTPATSSRTWTLPDLTTSPTFAALEGTQTFTGTKTFDDFRGTFGADIAAGSHKITGLAAPTATNDALSYGNLVASSDGSVSAPGMTFGSDIDTGFYHVGANDFAVALGGIKAVEFFSAGTTNATTYRQFIIGGTKATEFEKQTTTGVSTSATTILSMNNDGGLVLVAGNDGTNSFIDLIMCTSQNNPTVILSKTITASPAARTYTATGFAQKVAMASGTYTVTAQSIEISL